MSEVGGPGTRPFRLLVMCTANQCRSPMAEQLAISLLRERGVDAQVVSAGVMDGGVPATRGAVKALARFDLDLSAHVSKRVDADTVGAADLILTMERKHLRTVAELDPTALDRAFTLKELDGLAAAVGPRPAGLAPRDWISRANAMRLPGSVLTLDPSQDLADPMGGPSRGYRRAAAEIESSLRGVLSRLFPG